MTNANMPYDWTIQNVSSETGIRVDIQGHPSHLHHPRRMSNDSLLLEQYPNISTPSHSSSRCINAYPQTPIDDSSSATFTTVALSPSIVSNVSTTSNHSSPSSDGSRHSLHEGVATSWVSGDDLSVQGPSAQGGAMQIDTAPPVQYAISPHGFEYQHPHTPSSALESQSPLTSSSATPTPLAMYGQAPYSAAYPLPRSASERARQPSQTPLILPDYHASASMSMYHPVMEPDMGPTANAVHYHPTDEPHGSPASNTRMNSPSPRIHDIVSENSQLRARIRQLEAELNATRAVAYNGYSNSPRSSITPMLNMSRSSSSSSSHHPASLPITEEFRASWDARTNARVKRFCTMNRAGNSLCAWHDSRRERRQYPARHAPPGVLNCGCTYEQALFEESLSRHGVGSYHPGDSVRMDPALRNPLLKLLEERYGYRDGDFERDPRTGSWKDDEGHDKWESLLAAGPGKSRK